MSRGDILLKAHHLINHEREDQYKNPEDSFARIAELWSAYLKYYDGCVLELKPIDVAFMMVLLKMARYEMKGDKDSLLDGAGYWGIASDMEK